MIQLTESLNAWDTPEFTNVLKRELESLDVGVLPLQQGLSQKAVMSLATSFR
jgi:hypothetical protein